MLNLTIPKYKKIENFVTGKPDFISFSQGTVKLEGTPHVIKNHVRDLLQTDTLDYYQYVGGIYPLRKKIAEDLSLKHQVSLQPEQIIITHGSIGGITDICLAFLRKGDEVLLPEPSYPSYLNIIKFSKAIPIYTPGYIEEQGKWFFDLEKIKASITSKTKMIILSNPSNPSGVCLTQADLEALVSLCEKSGIYLVLDEVYDNFIYEGTISSGTPFVLKSPLVFRTGSFSKDFAMSGFRIGFLVAHETHIPTLIATQDGTLCCPSVIGQHAALHALEHKELIIDQVNTVRNNLEICCKALKPLMERNLLTFAKPQAGIFLFLKTPYADSEELVMDILHRAKVALVPGKDFGNTPSTQSSMRLCFARKEVILREGLRRLIDYFK